MKMLENGEQSLFKLLLKDNVEIDVDYDNMLNFQIIKFQHGNCVHFVFHSTLKLFPAAFSTSFNVP